MTSEQTLEEDGELAQELSRGKRVLGRGKSQCRGPKLEGCLACRRNSRGQIAGARIADEVRQWGQAMQGCGLL